MNNYYFLSYPMDPDAPRPPAIPEPEVTEFMTIADDGANVQRICYYNHTGTHLDTAAHVFEDGISMEMFEPGDFIFYNAVIIDFKLPDCHHIEPSDLMPFKDLIADCDMVIVRCGVENIRRCEPARFSSELPGFTVGAAGWLREHCPRLRCLGTDLPSFSVISDLENTMKAHNVFLQDNKSKMMIIEEMKLDVAPLNPVEIIISPWLIKGVNSGPCSVIAIK